MRLSHTALLLAAALAAAAGAAGANAARVAPDAAVAASPATSPQTLAEAGGLTAADAAPAPTVAPVGTKLTAVSSLLLRRHFSLRLLAAAPPAWGRPGALQASARPARARPLTPCLLLLTSSPRPLRPPIPAPTHM
jgi:hypothetical protein